MNRLKQYHSVKQSIGCVFSIFKHMENMFELEHLDCEVGTNIR